MRKRGKPFQPSNLPVIDVIDDQVAVGREEPQVFHQVLGQISDRESQQAAWMVTDPEVVPFHVRFLARQFEARVGDAYIGLRGVTDPRFDAVEFARLLVAAW